MNKLISKARELYAECGLAVADTVINAVILNFNPDKNYSITRANNYNGHVTADCVLVYLAGILTEDNPADDSVQKLYQLVEKLPEYKLEILRRSPQFNEIYDRVSEE